MFSGKFIVYLLIDHKNMKLKTLQSKDFQTETEEKCCKYLIVAGSFSNNCILAIYTVITLLNRGSFLLFFSALLLVLFIFSS